jgi:hypothetical protein
MRLPRAFQPSLTWLTGKPHRGQTPLWKSSSLTQTVSALLSLAGGVMLAGWGYSRGGFAFVLIPVGWLLIAGAARKIQVTLIHQCAHFDFSGNKQVDVLIGNILGLLVWVDHFENYFNDHILIHHTKQLGSAVDPDCKFLLELGFSQDLSKRELWHKLWATMVSPRFHYIFARSRFHSNLMRGARARVIAGWCILAMGTPLAIHFWGWSTLVVAWLIPIFAVYHIAALLNFSSLHFWLSPQPEHYSFKQKLCAMTAGRFMGERPPAQHLTGAPWILAWTKWWLRLFFIHLPLRVCVVPGDLPVHDYHHRHPLNKNWAEYLFLRQRDIEAGCPRWEIPYSENWGLYNCIDRVFTRMSKVEINHEKAI